MAGEFLKEFRQRHEAAVDYLESIQAGKTAEVSLDDVAKQLKALKLFLADHAARLTKYDLKRRQGDIRSLEDALAVKSSLLSSSTFSFDISNPSFTFAKPEAEKIEPVEDKVDKGENESTKAPVIEASDTFLISNANDLALTLEGEEAKSKVTGKELEVRNSHRCKIKVFTHLAAIRVTNCSDCELICGPVASSVFVECAQNCLFVTAAHQFRIHRAVDCRFYIHVTSRAIIEACKQLEFAPYNLDYRSMADDFSAAKLSLNSSENNWDKVNDFDWPSASASKPSPNWSIIPDVKRVGTWK